MSELKKVEVLKTKRFVIRKSLIGKNVVITFTNKKQEQVSYNHDEVYNTHKDKFETFPINSILKINTIIYINSNNFNKKYQTNYINTLNYSNINSNNIK